MMMDWSDLYDVRWKALAATFLFIVSLLTVLIMADWFRAQGTTTSKEAAPSQPEVAQHAPQQSQPQSQPSEKPPLSRLKPHPQEAVSHSSHSEIRHLAGRWSHDVRVSARKAGVPAIIVAAVLHVESHGYPWSKSSAGAVGLMQVKPLTARSVGVRIWWHPKRNILAGARYLARLLKRFHGNLRLAIAAYNAGPKYVVAYDGVPPFPETRAYVDKVMQLIGVSN